MAMILKALHSNTLKLKTKQPPEASQHTWHTQRT